MAGISWTNARHSQHCSRNARYDSIAVINKPNSIQKNIISMTQSLSYHLLQCSSLTFSGDNNVHL